MARKVTIILGLLLLTHSALAQTTLTLWRHETGDEEMNENLAQIEAFNASQDEWEIVRETLPQGSYTESVTAAALAGELPCIFDMDQPTVPNFAWAGHVRSLNEYIPQEMIDDLTPGAFGTYKDEIYSLGQFDVALALFGRRSVLEENGIRIATLEEPYTLEEFNEVLATLSEVEGFDYPFDVNAGSTGEWYSYAYSPWLQSFGGDLIDRESYLEAEGVLNGEEAVEFGEWFQALFEDGYAPASPPDDQSFIQGRVPLFYTGSWAIGPYTDAWGEDVVVMPPPDFGTGPKIGSGSWQWGISSTCENPEGAWDFIEFIMQPEQIAAMSDATSLIPTSEAAAALTENYREGGQWRMFYDYAANYAVPRPETPGYPFISSTFEQTMLAIRDGGDVQDNLDDAVDAIERNIDDNGGYGFE